MAEEAASDFRQNQPAPQDMVAVISLTLISGLTFTRSHDSRPVDQEFRGAGIYEPRNEFEERYAYYPTQTVGNIRTK